MLLDQRRHLTQLRWAAMVALLVLAFGTSSTSAAIGDTTRISVNSNEQQAFQDVRSPAVSADGSFVALQSEAANLVPGDTNGESDIFVRDRVAGTTTRVSVASDGIQGNGPSFYAAITDDGRLVAFTSWSSNLVSDDTNGVADVFLHDRQTGVTTRISLNSDGQQGIFHSFEVAISADGQVVAFIAGRVDSDVWIKDLQTGQLRRANLNTAGKPAYGGVVALHISADGRYIAYTSNATDLVPGDTNGLWDAFVHDRQARVTTRVNLSSTGQQATDGITRNAVSISGDGRYVAFASYAGNLVPGATHGTERVYVHDRQTGATTLASLDRLGQPDAGSHPAMSADGRFVAFRSSSSDLVPNDTNGDDDVFVRDLATGAMTLVSVASDGTQGNNLSLNPEIDADGTLVVFESEATNLVAGDSNGDADLFARELAPAPPVYSCDGLAQATIVGTDGDDTLIGTEGPDVIVGLAGDDTIHGLGGNDLICGDGFVNVTSVVSGDDTLYGDAGDDQLVGSEGFDVLVGGTDNDLLRGNGNADELAGEAGDDDLRGGWGPDQLDGGAGIDSLDGGHQSDTCVNGETLLNCP